MTVSPCLKSRPLLLFVHGSAEMYGSDKVLLNLATAFAAAGNMQPVVVLQEDGPLRCALVAAGVETHVATVLKITRAMFSWSAPWELLRLGRAAIHDLDKVAGLRTVAVVHSNTLAVLGGALWAWRRRRPHVWHVHEIILSPAVVGRALPWLADRLSQRVIANSSATQQWLVGAAPSLAGRSVVVFNGLPAAPLTNTTGVAAFRANIGASDEDVVATVAGRLNHWKGQGLLVEAFTLLARQGRLGNLRLAIVGSVFAGHEDILSQLVTQVRGCGLDERIRFLDFVDDIYSVWRGSQIAVVPSIEPEPFGMVAIEAMACGLPVVAAGHGGLLDIVEDGVTGLLFTARDVPSLADALAKLAADPSLRERLGAAGQRRQSQRFSIDSQVEETEAVYRSLAASGARSA